MDVLSIKSSALYALKHLQVAEKDRYTLQLMESKEKPTLLGMGERKAKRDRDGLLTIPTLIRSHHDAFPTYYLYGLSPCFDLSLMTCKEKKPTLSDLDEQTINKLTLIRYPSNTRWAYLLYTVLSDGESRLLTLNEDWLSETDIFDHKKSWVSLAEHEELYRVIESFQRHTSPPSRVPHLFKWSSPLLEEIDFNAQALTVSPMENEAIYELIQSKRAHTPEYRSDISRASVDDHNKIAPSKITLGLCTIGPLPTLDFWGAIYRFSMTYLLWSLGFSTDLGKAGFATVEGVPLVSSVLFYIKLIRCILKAIECQSTQRFSYKTAYVEPWASDYTLSCFLKVIAQWRTGDPAYSVARLNIGKYDLRELQYLDLSNKNLTSPDMETLLHQVSLQEGTTHLQNLSLANNQLIRFNMTLTPTLPQLQYLDLSNNALEDDDALLLGDLPHLTSLDLSDNGFKPSRTPRFNPCLICCRWM